MNDKDMFFLSPMNQLRFIRVMEALEKQEFPMDNRTVTVVLHLMRDQGLLPKAYGTKEMLGLIKKRVPEGGKILHIRENDNG